MEERVSAGGGPLERVGRAVLHLSPGAAVAIGVALTVAAGLLDYLTGPELAPLTFYLVPIAIVAWGGTRWQGVACAVVAGSFWAIAEALDGRAYETAWLFVWSSLTRLVVLLTVAVLLHRARSGPRPPVAGATEITCPHCGSADTVVMRMGLVCRRCKRLS